MGKDASVGAVKQGPQIDWVTTIGWLLVIGGTIYLFVTLLWGPQGGRIVLLEIGRMPLGEVLLRLACQWYLWPCLLGLILGVIGIVRRGGKDAMRLTATAAAVLVLGVLRGLMP